MRFASALAILLVAANVRAESDPADARMQLSQQLAAELQTIDHARSLVADKLAAADAARVRRIRAAYRILRAPLPANATEADRMASARRRAAARLLIERDKEERTLLATEATQLSGARTTKVDATAKLPTLQLPPHIGRPAKGKISRGFGTYVHERSKATLSRRGLDFETERNAPAWAPADGVVRYAGAIRGLDHGVILDHGDYLTVVAKLADVTLSAGTRVQKGDRLGRAARYRVYLEVRAKVAPGGLPIDPQPLLEDRAP